MPSLAIPLCLLLLAGAQPDPLSPPPQGRGAEVATPSLPTAPSVRATPMPTDPGSVPVRKARGRHRAARSGPAGSAKFQSPPEETLTEARPRHRPHRRRAHKRTEDRVEYPDAPEGRSPWGADRYAAIVPPGLTLAALRKQLAEVGGPTAQGAGSEADGADSSQQTLEQIQKAREALRQETARLEALLKAAGNCGGAVSAPIGEPLTSASPLSAAALRDTSGEQIDAVSKAMKGMKPDQAAAVLGRLDRRLAAEVLRRMKASDAGSILGFLKPELAAELATEIATSKPIYGKGKKGGSR